MTEFVMDTPVLHITLDEDGMARTVNGWVKVKMIIQRHLLADEPLAEIADFYNISLADVHAAMAYYYDNQTSIDALFEQAQTLLTQQGVDGSQFKATIQARLKKINSD